MKVARGPAAWAKRGLIAAVLVGAAIIPGRASSSQPEHCSGLRCTTPGSVLWTRPLSGSWLAQPGVSGTVTSQGGAYAASGAGLAIVGTGTTVTAISEATGRQLWRVSLAGFPAGSSISGVRAFTSAVAVGIEPPAGQPDGRREVILSAASGAQLGSFTAAPYGGAVAATGTSAVIIGTRTVTDFATRTGRVIWSRPTGSAGQTWRVSGGYLYVTDSGGGSLAGSGVAAVRRIDLRTGAEQLIRPARGVFPGELTEAAGGDLLFAGPEQVWAYDATGRLLWTLPSTGVELADSGQTTVYLTSGSRLLGVSIASGSVVSSSAVSVAASLYWVKGGIALGLDENGLGDAWGYDLKSRRVAWSSTGLPWPHFFVDLSGLGGSATPSGDMVLLATCAQVGSAASANSAPHCTRPELAAVLTSKR